MKITELLFAFLRFEICGTPLSEETKNSITSETLPALYQLSKAHDVAHLVGDALDKCGLLPTDTEVGKNFLSQRSIAVFRYEQIQYELEEVCRTLEGDKREHIPLKGSVLRKYYPEPWMRTSCDIDILVHEEQLDEATETLVRELGYEKKEKSAHDVSMFAESGVHLELHYGLIEERIAPESGNVLSQTWEYTKAKEGCTYCKEMTDEMFYFYHVAHMAKHFTLGGCGIRPFLDLLILDEKIQYNEELLRKGKLLKFTSEARRLSNVWFLGEEHTPFTLELEQFILCGGVYGTVQNRVAVQQRKKGGKFRYALSRIFLSYDELKFRYPSLQKHKWLFPLFQVRRWFKLIFGGGVKRSVRELNANATTTEEKQQRIEAMLKALEL